MKKMFVVISTYLKSLEEINEKRGDHLAFINNYVLAGKFIMLGRKNPVDGAVIIAHNVTKEELEEKTLPELKEVARLKKLTGFSTMKKQEIIDLIINN